MTGAAASANRYSLRTFGTLTLIGADERTVLGQHGHHRRRLALLAVLAAAGERGWSRDQLLLFFWPEATQARARHSLEQLLYALRTSMGEQLFAATNPVVLNPNVIGSDVAEFIAALDRDDFDAAVRAYRGPFLEGFYVDDAPEFERWVEEERGRLRGRYISALERLAETADTNGDNASSVRWWRALVDAEPLSARSALGFMRALHAAGDHAAVLQFAEQYEAAVTRELGTSVGPAVTSFVADVRAAAGTQRLTRPRFASEPVPTPAFPGTMPVPAREAVSRSSLYRVVAATALLAAFAAIAAAIKGNGGPAPLPSSIAVLPLTNVSRHPSDSVFVDALSDELINTLTKVSNLRVISSQSSFAFRGSTIGAQRIGDTLRVTHLLEGSAQREGGRLRVRIRLVDTDNGVAVWSGNYAPPIGDVFAMQTEIASAVARELNLELGRNVAERLRRGPTRSIEAWEAYVSGRNPINARSESTAARGLAELQRAVELDSTFAAAYAAMPFMYLVGIVSASNAAQVRGLQQRAESVARKALAIDPELPEAHVGLSVALAMDYRDLPGAERALRQALALGGTPRIREHLSRVLMWSGRHAESLEEALRAVDEDPLSAPAAADLGEALCVNGRTREGLKQLEKVAALQRPLLRVPGYMAVCYMMEGNWAAASAVLANTRGETPWSVLRGYAVARSGDVAGAQEMERLALDRWRQTGRGAISIALIEEGLGNRDKAFEWLERAAEDRLVSAGVMYPVFKDLQADRRFESFRQGIGLMSSR